VREATASCEYCHASLRKFDLKFGVAPKYLGAITDPGQLLSPAERRRLSRLLALFQRKFPQITLAVYLGEVPAGALIGEYTFWLANRMHFSAMEAAGEKNFDLLLVVNTAGEAGLSAGYGLERLVGEEDLSRALDAGTEAFAAERWAAGIERCVECLIERLRDLGEKKK
jgi:uncharacterized membrane protein YgcG